MLRVCGQTVSVIVPEPTRGGNAPVPPRPPGAQHAQPAQPGQPGAQCDGATRSEIDLRAGCVLQADRHVVHAVTVFHSHQSHRAVCSAMAMPYTV